MNSLVRTKYRNICSTIRCTYYRVYVIARRPIYKASEFTLHSIHTFANSLKFTDSTTVSTGIFKGSLASSAFQWRLGSSAFYHIDKQGDRYFSKKCTLRRDASTFYTYYSYICLNTVKSTRLAKLLFPNPIPDYRLPVYLPPFPSRDNRPLLASVGTAS